MHQKENDYPLINPRRQLSSLITLFALKTQSLKKKENSLSLKNMSMNKNTPAAGKNLNPPPLNLLDYSDDEEQTTPQQSQTSQSLSEDLHTAAEKLDYESDGKSEPVRSTRKKKNVKEERSKQSSEAIIEEAEANWICKENRGKAIEVSSGESKEEDDSEKSDSDEAEEVVAEEVEPTISIN